MTRIEQGQHLLKMIESVDPEDTNKLDEIDERVFCFLFIKTDMGAILKPKDKYPSPNYTRNLQALHTVMPDGWYMSGGGYNNVGKFWTFKMFNWSGNETIYSRPLPTMHLAWLHAITQAYIWEIENNDL